MLIALARRSIADALSPAFRPLLLRSLMWTLLAFAVVWVGGTWLIARLAGSVVGEPASWWLSWAGGAASWGAGLLSGILLFVGLMFLIVPISTLIASLFLDGVAETVERRDYPADPVGTPTELGASIWNALRFTAVVITINAICLALLLVPGINLVAFFFSNGYLLGREYFELAALRHRPRADAEILRRRHAGTLMLAGLIVAGILSVPVLNLITPVFATIFMVHLHKHLAAETARLALDAAAARR